MKTFRQYLSEQAINEEKIRFKGDSSGFQTKAKELGYTVRYDNKAGRLNAADSKGNPVGVYFFYADKHKELEDTGYLES